MPHFTRRELLQGLSLGAGAALANPLVCQLAAQAASDSTAPRMRFVFVVQSNGMNPAHITPVGVQRKSPNAMQTNTELIELDLNEHKLHPALEPLAPFQSRVGLVQGLSNRIAYSDHSCELGALGCYPKGKALAPTIDQVLAKSMPGVFQHVGIGYSERSANVYCYSATGPGQPAPIVCSPEQACKSLFGIANPDLGQSEFALKTNLLDFMADDVRRSRAALVGDELAKFDSYVAAFESLHQRQAKLLAMREKLARHAPQLGEKLTTSVSSLILEAQFENAAAALIAGLTNVVTLTSGGGGQQFGAFPELGIPELHRIGHGGTYEGKTNDECFVAIRLVHTRLIAELARKLAAVPEGNGSLLDHTLIVYLSDSGDSHHPSGYQWPVVLLGNLGGRLNSAGRYLDFPKYGARGHRTLANFYCTLLHAAGLPSEKFGVPDPVLKDHDQTGPLHPLLNA